MLNVNLISKNQLIHYLDLLTNKEVGIAKNTKDLEGQMSSNYIVRTLVRFIM